MDSARHLICIFIGASLACEAATSSTPWSSLQVVPGNLNQDTEGNDSTLVPFGSFGFPVFEDCGSVRYQQVITAGEFQASPQPLRYIWSMMFMIDPCNKEGSTLMNLGIRFSTTERGADELSTKFAENIGPDQLEVYRVEGRGFGDVGSCSGKPFPVDGRNWYIFDKPFPYSPLLGNLLLDIEYDGKVIQGARGVRMDAQTVQGDGISRVYGCPRNASNAQGADTGGLVLVLFMVRPELTITNVGETILVDWSYWLPWFRLQFSDTVGMGTVWKDYVGEIGNLGRTMRRATIPASTLGTERYFRLVADSLSPPSTRLN